VYEDLGAFWDEAGIEVCERWENSSWVGPHCGPMDVPWDPGNPDLWEPLKTGGKSLNDSFLE
jgi:hypothetical protein